MKAVIFDLDGTLLNTLQDITDAANTALREFGYPTHSVDSYREYVGEGLSVLAAKALPEGHRSEADVRRFSDRYREVYAQIWSRTSVPYPGVLPMLSEIAASGTKLAVLSNKRDDFTKLCVARLVSGVHFEIVRGEVEGVPLKPDPKGLITMLDEIGVEPESAVYIGDTEHDVHAALSAGMRCIAATWGFRPKEVLANAGATVFADSADEVLQKLTEFAH